MKKSLFVSFCICVFSLTAEAALVDFWVSDGGNKVARQDFYPHGYSTNTATRNWDGTTAKTFGARNETVSLVLYMLSDGTDSTEVNVIVSSLTGPSGSGIVSVDVSSSNVFDWTTRPIEVFYVRYLQILGLSQLNYDPSEYDARHYPYDWRVYCVPEGGDRCDPEITAPSTWLWTNRFGHDKFYPDILVPMEAVAASSFTVSASSSQAIWIDYYIAKNLTPGTYTGSIKVREGVSVSTTIPVELIVYNATLPDVPTMKTMAYISVSNVAFRHHGDRFPSLNLVEPFYTTQKRYKQMLHRHKVTPIGYENLTSDVPYPIDVAKLDGSLYAATTGYGNAPGVDTGDKVYSIATYGSWRTGWTGATTNPDTLCSHVSNWQDYFASNFPDVKSFLYLIDEPANLVETDKWSTWMATVTACQHTTYEVPSFVTSRWTDTLADAPNLQMPATTTWMSASSTTWEAAADYYQQVDSSTQAWAYNGSSPHTASPFMHEEEGWGPREIAWGAFKKGAVRTGVAIPWFLWETTYFYDDNNDNNENDLWNTAQTFGYDIYPTTSNIKGRTGSLYANGDGVLMYPGTDLSYPANDYNLDGPLASWRLKMFRRGVQDADIMAQAYAINPTATMDIVDDIATTVLWEKYCRNVQPPDCGFTYGERGFMQEAGAYEDAREALLEIIASAAASTAIRGTLKAQGGVGIR